MLPINSGGHAAYQTFLLKQLSIHYPNPHSIDSQTWNIIDRFYYKDLSNVDVSLIDCYSTLGAPPRLPSCMLRSILLSLTFKVNSYTKWATQLKLNPLYAILCGFEVGDTPGIGTFYDFHKRLWMSDDKNFSPHERPPKPSVTKPTKAGDKADSVEQITVESLIEQHLISPPSTEQPFSKLFELFKQEFLDVSVSKGLINTDELSLSGDGTSAVTSAYLRKHRVCSCRDNAIFNCGCDRFYSQPDCDVGWDSTRKCFYHGYNLYLLTECTSAHNLPIFPLLNPASRHDSIAFTQSFFLMQSFIPYASIDKLLLDSAHDALSIYSFCKSHSITPFIDLNQKRGAPLKFKDDFTIDTDGIPICKEGHRMRRDGVEKRKFRLKFRCPLMNRQSGSSCDHPCSDAKYGRTVHLSMNDNPRLFNIPPRGSKQWIEHYKARTASERNNKRIKIDYQLENGKHRSSREWYCRLFCIMMCQHLDAWDLSQESSAKNHLLQVA